MHGIPHSVLVASSLGSTYDGQCGQAWCVKWHPDSMHEKIAAGFCDGECHVPHQLFIPSRWCWRPKPYQLTLGYFTKLNLIDTCFISKESALTCFPLFVFLSINYNFIIAPPSNLHLFSVAEELANWFSSLVHFRKYYHLEFVDRVSVVERTSNIRKKNYS